MIQLRDDWNKLDYLIRKVIRIAIDRYNKRVAKQISDYMGWSSDEVLTIINLMKDNKENYLDGSN